MIKVTIDLYPFGDINGKETLKEITIINNASNKDRPALGNYDVILDDVTYKNVVTDHFRKDGILLLLRKILNSSIV